MGNGEDVRLQASDYTLLATAAEWFAEWLDAQAAASGTEWAASAHPYVLKYRRLAETAKNRAALLGDGWEAVLHPADVESIERIEELMEADGEPAEKAVFIDRPNGASQKGAEATGIDEATNRRLAALLGLDTAPPGEPDANETP